MKSTQIFPMFTSLTEAQEVSLSGGESNIVSYSYTTIDKKGKKKQIIKVVKTNTPKGKTSVSGLLKKIEIKLPSLPSLSSLLKFDW
ncbi:MULTISPECIES: hypothetical protein [unclassified Nostoc]|uniref:hypothetical protein n=1 Tax=unclassified Nostoc TaxID=2593658 RepID=UPI002AD5141E|nr:MULTISPECIES: hypothetical protein [unclassified Nostoc]MDZ8122574.1 hypothetical protein [Nostoc sp. CmiVER01]MDZ8227391.1 hypothetical protein [Nostoc sp. ChiVER01]